ncbi:class I SAM-dependent methyltransferase [Halococcus sp. IIIV-5B]|uniref:class I SAM-dependent methyltransferase n=1 Tax=Halococcus sp. IIIV-5B TaxID=2321230 RepID=UPI000E70EC0D|nr:class I SAM-dependent methyltransferase [Halococcus sp. IIIV-5B]RJT07565.1 class I SAM-dependent methyltransferase [Halococcus sp. IIIV-5B]
MEKAALLSEQYADEANLSTRGEFNARFLVDDHHPHDWVYSELPLAPDATVLDVGCGPGGFWTVNSEHISESWKAVLSDFSSGMVSEAENQLQENSIGGDFTIADTEHLPFAQETFNMVLALQMLYHSPYLAVAIQECERVLAADGCLYATTGSSQNVAQLYKMMSTVADGSVSSLVGGFTAENGREQLGKHFDHVERRLFENEVRVDDPDALTAYALSLPLEDSRLSAFDAEDAEALRELAAAHIREHGAVRWTKDMTLFIAKS